MRATDNRVPPDVSPQGIRRRADWPIRVPTIAHLTIEGLACPHCAERIRATLTSSPEILGVEVDLGTHQVDIMFDVSRLRLDGLAALIASAAEDGPACDEVLQAQFS